MAVIATIYMRIFLPDSIGDNGARRNSKEEVIVPLLDEHKDSRNNVRVFKTMPSFDDSISLLRSRSDSLSLSLSNLITRVFIWLCLELVEGRESN